jgi:hypothetical protein
MGNCFGSSTGPAAVGRRDAGKLVNPGCGPVELHLWPDGGPWEQRTPKGTTVAQTGVVTQLGFLTVLHDATGYLGGYLVTNVWGRPMEFRLSTAVQPNRVQQILYGHTLPGFLHGELIGKTLVEKTATPVTLIFTDSRPALALRSSLDVPVLWIATDEPEPQSVGLVVRPATEKQPALVGHARFPDDAQRIRDVLEQLDANLDLLEPFSRIREAITEARKMGVTGRAS